MSATPTAPPQSAFSAGAIATLALGIGVHTAMFNAVEAVLIRPLPYADADRLVMIWDDLSRTGFSKHYSTPGEWHEWRRSNTVLLLSRETVRRSETGGGLLLQTFQHCGSSLSASAAKSC